MAWSGHEITQIELHKWEASSYFELQPEQRGLKKKRGTGLEPEVEKSKSPARDFLPLRRLQLSVRHTVGWWTAGLCSLSISW